MIKWNKIGFFDDLKPFDILPLENFLDRYLATLKTFDQYEDQVKEGFFFLGIDSNTLDDPEVRYFHEKYNHPNCDITKEPRDKLCMMYRAKNNFNRPEFHGEENIKFTGGTSNYNGRDGQIRGGWATPNIETIHINPVREGLLTGKWIYLEFPYELFYDHTDITINGAPIDKAKQFVKEVDDTIGWEDPYKVEELVNKYDKLYPDWSHDFPINGFQQVKEEGLIFPGVWWNYNLILGHSYHRMIMTSFNKMNFPYILPVPNVKNGKWYVCSRGNTFTYKNELHYLGAEIDTIKRDIKYTFTKNPNWAKSKNLDLL